MVLSSAAADQIRQWGRGLPRGISIRFRMAADDRSGEFDRFLQDFARWAEKVRIVPEESDAGEFPAILISPNLTYQALPYDRELVPFMQMLTHTLGELEPLEQTSMDRLGQIVWPAEIKIFIAPTCPHCPEVVKKLAPLAFHQPLIRISIIDGILFPEVSGPLGVRSVPTVLLDDRFRWTGPVDMTEFLDTLIHRDAALLPASSLKKLLKEGQAAQLAAMMLERGEVFSAFADLVTHPEWSVRLGAVVVAEEIIEKDPMLAQSILPPLWERFHAADVTVKGDILYLVGLAGSEEWAPRLRGLLSAELPDDLRESVQEALARW